MAGREEQVIGAGCHGRGGDELPILVYGGRRLWWAAPLVGGASGVRRRWWAAPVAASVGGGGAGPTEMSYGDWGRNSGHLFASHRI
jgi:hypothetical protein